MRRKLRTRASLCPREAHTMSSVRPSCIVTYVAANISAMSSNALGIDTDRTEPAEHHRDEHEPDQAAFGIEPVWSPSWYTSTTTTRPRTAPASRARRAASDDRQAGATAASPQRRRPDRRTVRSAAPCRSHRRRGRGTGLRGTTAWVVIAGAAGQGQAMTFDEAMAFQAEFCAKSGRAVDRRMLPRAGGCARRR